MRERMVIVLVGIGLALTGCRKELPESAPANPEAQKAAVEAARAWLALVDQGQYEQSWEASAQFFRKVVAKEQWQQQLAAFRDPLGKQVSRQVKKTIYTTTAPGAPDGEYVIIEFDASFENKKTAIETVTPMKEPDGVWRVSGYYIR